MIVDTHCHLSYDLYTNLDDVISRMDDNIMVAAGTNLEDSKEVIALVDKYPNIYGVIGIHPSELNDYSDEALTWLSRHLDNPKIIGVGEIGLDYKNGTADHELQKEAFIKQIKLAQAYHKTVVIHSRDAANDTLTILKQYLGQTKAVLHCYNYSYELALAFSKMPIMFGIGGVVTFNNAKKLVSVVKKLDLKYLLLETDAPFLSPEPYRGQKNEPKNVFLVAKRVAEIKETEVDKIVEITSQNFIRQFDLGGQIML